MRFRKKRFLPSLAKAPTLRAIRTAYSVRYHVFNPKVNEQLCSISRQADFKLVTINYGRLKHWLKKGLSFHRDNLIQTDNVIWHKGFRPLTNFMSEYSKLPKPNSATKTKS